MAFIKTISPEQSEGKMKEAYDMFIHRLGVIPKPIGMMSASPANFKRQLPKIQYYTDHLTLNFTVPYPVSRTT